MRNLEIGPKTPSLQIYGNSRFPEGELGSLSVGSESLCHVGECAWDPHGILGGQQVMPGKDRDGTLLGCRFSFCHLEAKFTRPYILEERIRGRESLAGEKYDLVWVLTGEWYGKHEKFHKIACVVFSYKKYMIILTNKKQNL